MWGWIYLLAVSVIAMFVTAADKIKAKNRKSRIRERTLFIWAILGGSVAMYLTMLGIRHKTKHKRFMIGIPLIIILQIAAVCAVLYLMA